MPTKQGWPSDRRCLGSRGQARVSRVRIRVLRTNSVTGARHTEGQPNWQKPRLNLGNPLVGFERN